MLLILALQLSIIVHSVATEEKELLEEKALGSEDDDSPQIPLANRTLGLIDSPFLERLLPGGYLLGDMVLSDVQFGRLFIENFGEAAINDVKLRWTDAVIPYVLDCSIDKLTNAVTAIKAAMKEWEAKTCIRFVPRTNQKKYLRFIRDTHCWGHVGMHDYSTISCGFGCEQQNVMAHEIGHAVGFHHEQNRKDRDNWVRILWNNIGKFKSAFEKVKNTYSLGVAYDYSSIMHYPWKAFSSNGGDTMSAIRNYYRLQPYRQISRPDIQQTSLMYNCPVIEKRRRMEDEILNEMARVSKQEEEANNMVLPPNADNAEIMAFEMNTDKQSECVDSSKSCGAWEKVGYCRLYPYVAKLCKITCKLCKGKEPCQGNKVQHCEAWAKIGHCSKKQYRGYMKRNCCHSCKGKGTKTKTTLVPTTTSLPTTAAPTTIKITAAPTTVKITAAPVTSKITAAPATTAQPTGDCTNRGEHCAAWGKKGYCKSTSSHSKWMLENCCVTCRGTRCIDANEECESWAEQGFCKRGDYKEYVATTCCKSCKGNRCADAKEECGDWANQGYCTREDYRKYMETNCCKSCKGTTKVTTKPVTAKPTKAASTSKPIEPTQAPKRKFLGTGVLCVDLNNQCPSLARRGECRRNRVYMEYYCKKSCRFQCDSPGLKPHGACANPLGLSYTPSGYSRIPDSAFTSGRGHLTMGGWNAYPSNARLYFPDDRTNKRIGAWCANTGKVTDDTLQSITVDLGRRKKITHIATQGRDKYFERISQFKLEYSDTGSANDFQPYKENGKEKVFQGSCDYRTPVLNKFVNTIQARYIKYIPWKWNYPCVRMEFYGCDAW